MRFNVSSKELYSAASAVSKVINSKNAMTVLNNFLFSLEGNQLTISASDLENTLAARVEVSDADGDGSFCVDARRVVDLLKELPDMGITFVINDDTLAIEILYPGGTFNFVGINGNEYPRSREENPDELRAEFDIPAEMVLKGIDNTSFAVGSDDLRPQMMGILWDIKNDGITFVATDTRKLVKYTNTMAAPGCECSFILPMKPATILKNIVAKEEMVHALIEPKSATITAGRYTFNCRFIKGNFPDYNRVIPVNNPYVLTVDRLALLNAVKRVGVFVDPGHGLVKFKLTPDQIIMKAQDNNFCTSAREAMPCDFTGNEMVIGFSAPYLIEIISTLSTDQMLIKLSDPSRPGVFVPQEDAKDSELLMLLMPMTVQEF
ncbi:MAG: DNA polymerase III subunit beta [Muribaculaceae bacterium]|nr:DNA polymerase III subunit beta [Muribaculaceae bacterium]